jgi:hypothetical protein
VIRVYDEAGNVIETHEHKGDYQSSIASLYAELRSFAAKNSQTVEETVKIAPSHAR